MASILLKIYAASFAVMYGYVILKFPTPIGALLFSILPCLVYSAIFTLFCAVFIVGPIKLYIARRG